MQKVHVVFMMIALTAGTAVLGQSSLTPRAIAAVEPGSCAPQQDRDAAQQTLHTAVSSILQQYQYNSNCGPGLWYRVAYLNIMDSAQQCPSNWMEISTPVRVCGRPTTTTASCPGEYFSTGSHQYSRVCGRVIGYQNGSADTFALRKSPHTINDPYVDGVSVTHGMPRNHIWTYAVGASEATVDNYRTDCPCADPASSTVPPPNFVGDNYYCESGNPGRGSAGGVVYRDDPVWDGEQCEGECCSNGKSPPWFSVTLPNPTSDDIEVRICGDEGTGNEDTPIQLLEMYIQ